MGSARQQPPRQADAAADAKSGMSPSDSLPVCSGGAGPVIPLIESEYEGLTGHPSDPCFICCDLHDIPIYELRVAEMRKRFQVGYGHVQSKVWVTEILAFCANTFTFPKNKPLTWSLRSVYEHFVQPHKVMDPATERVKQIKHVNLEIAKIERKFLFKIDDNGKEVLCVKTAKLLDSKRAYLLKLMIASK